MTLKNEIFEGIAAYKGLTPTSQDDYYNYRLQQLKNKQKKDDEVEAEGKAEVDRQNARRMGVTGPVAPTVASSAVPGSPQTAMATGWDPSQPAGPDNVPVARQGGMIRKFRPGGPVTPPEPDDDDDEEDDSDPFIDRLLSPLGRDAPTEAKAKRKALKTDTPVQSFADGGSAGGSGSPDPNLPDPGDAPPVDNLIRELLQRGNEQAGERINRDVGEPWTVLAPNSEWAKEGATQRAANLDKTRGAQARDEQAFQTSAPTVQPTTRAGRVLTAINDVVSPPGSRGETTRRERDLADVRTARDKIPGLLTPSTPGEVATTSEAAAAKQREVARGGPEPTPEPPDPTDPAVLAGIEPSSWTDRALDTARSAADAIPAMVRRAAGAAEPAPVGAGAGTAAGPQVAAAAPAAPPRPTQPPPTALQPRTPWTQQAPQPSLGLPAEALQRPSAAPPPAQAPPPAAPPAPKTGPTGTSSSPAPPAPGSTTPNAPSTAPKPPKGSLGDQTREKAFDPTADMNDPGNAHRVDTSGQTINVTPQDIHTVLGAGMSQAPAGGAMPPPGQGAVSRPMFNQWIAAHDQGGRLTSGQALIAGMVGKYKALLSQGRQAEASQMAWGLMQAANLEAASYGDVAADAYKAGDQRGVTSAVAKAADLQPDGMHHRPSADGRSVETYDSNGRLTGVTRMDGSMALAAIMGLRDGTLMWQALQQAVASTQKPDRNAEGRQLTNELRRQQIEGARLRNKKLASGGGGGGGGTAAGQQLASLFGQTKPEAYTGGRPQGSDDSWIDAEHPDPVELE